MTYKNSGNIPYLQPEMTDIEIQGNIPYLQPEMTDIETQGIFVIYNQK